MLTNVSCLTFTVAKREYARILLEVMNVNALMVFNVISTLDNAWILMNASELN